MRRLRKIFIVLCIMVCAQVAHAKHLHRESWYQEQWCSARGEVEYILPDRARVDCLTSGYAVEVDFGAKWAEAVGQSMYYSSQTGKKAGIVLILEQEKDQKYWTRLMRTLQYFALDIDVWAVGENSGGRYYVNGQEGASQ